ncbi:MAG: alpha/beta hydrolase [Pseudomonadota bacterium]
MTWTILQRSDVINGVSCYRQGDGPQLMLIHGVGLRAEAWRGQIDVLADHFSVCAIDMPGHGESDLLDPESGLAEFSDRISSVIEELNQPVILMGHSMGGMITMDIAANSPHLCKAIVVLNAICGRSPEASEAVKQRAASLSIDSTPSPDDPLHRWFGEDQTVPQAVACRSWLTSVDPVGYKTAYSVFANNNGPTDAELEALACPALFMTGSEEPNSTPAMSEKMAKLAPKGKAVIIEGAAHMMPMTHAAEVNAHILEFMKAEGVIQ